MPVYKIKVQTEVPSTRLISASTKTAAINHVVDNLVTAEVLTADEVVAEMNAGEKVEILTKEAKPEEKPVEAETKTE